jgi:RHS repeat-associated protein
MSISQKASFIRRATGFTLKDGTALENQAAYNYDAFSRLSSASGGSAQVIATATTFSYTRIQNSSLIAQVSGPAHRVTNTWEVDRDVLDVKENKVGSSVVSKLDYSVNAIGQRTALSQTGTAFASVRGLIWSYDSYGQVTLADSTINSQDRAYQFDAIGNRQKFATSLTLPVADNFTANNLNQYSAIAAISPVYDADGNATSYPLPVSPDANGTLRWDGENRLISTTVGGITTSQQFDAMGRRISKTTGTASTLYLYEGWNVIAEYTKNGAAAPSLSKTQLWGLDLSGSLQGAGGVGGLLSQTVGSATHFPTYDGNGNVSEYLTATGTVAAHFEYDAFGNTVVNTDTTNQFAYKFSTKPQDLETGLYYYGYRSYDPVTGRWISKDPLGERGGRNLYGMVGNKPINRYDLLGLFVAPSSAATLLNSGVTAAEAAAAGESAAIAAAEGQVALAAEARLAATLASAETIPLVAATTGLVVMSWKLGLESVELENSLARLHEAEQSALDLTKRIEDIEKEDRQFNNSMRLQLQKETSNIWSNIAVASSKVGVSTSQIRVLLAETASALENARNLVIQLCK